MNDSLESLLERLSQLEKEVLREMQRKEAEFFYEVRQGRVRFTAEARTRHRRLAKRFTDYLRDSRLLILLSAPVIWSCLLPLMLVDLVMSLYQAICFPIYGIPKVRRRDYIRLDRRHLDYLNWAEKLNCESAATPMACSPVRPRSLRVPSSTGVRSNMPCV